MKIDKIEHISKHYNFNNYKEKRKETQKEYKDISIDKYVNILKKDKTVNSDGIFEADFPNLNREEFKKILEDI